MWAALLTTSIADWLFGHGVCGGQAMIATLRHRLIHHAHGLKLRLLPNASCSTLTPAALDHSSRGARTTDLVLIMVCGSHNDTVATKNRRSRRVVEVLATYSHSVQVVDLRLCHASALTSPVRIPRPSAQPRWSLRETPR
jgi:hypothetical protein